MVFGDLGILFYALLLMLRIIDDLGSQGHWWYLKGRILSVVA